VSWILQHIEPFIFLVVVLAGIFAPLFRSRTTQQTGAPGRGRMPMDQQTLEGNLRRAMREAKVEARREPPRAAPAPSARKAPERARAVRSTSDTAPSTGAPPAPPMALTTTAETDRAMRDPDQRIPFKPAPPRAGEPAAAAGATTSPARLQANEIRQLLRRRGLRQGILLKEILEPPLGERMPRELTF
jgi:hypothetical protein